MWPFDKSKDNSLTADINRVPVDPSVVEILAQYEVKRSKDKEKLGLCLAGGGSKGRWQIGFLARAAEMGLLKYVDIVAGTSVGGLNGLITARYLSCFQKAIDVWRGIKVNSDVYLGTMPSGFWSIAWMLIQGKLTGPSILNVSPLQAVVEANLSGPLEIPAMIVTTERVTGSKQIFSTLEGAHPVDMAMATSSVPSAFPAYSDEFLDGGCVSNVPVFELEEVGNVTKMVILYCDPEKSNKSAGPPTVLNNGLSAINAMYSVQEERTYREVELIRQLREAKNQGQVEYCHFYPSIDTGQLLDFSKTDLLQKGYQDGCTYLTVDKLKAFLLS
jgi:predicted acylesterase/phospholipase RssA